MVTLSFICLGLLSLWGVRGEVAQNFDNCIDFFFRATPVSGLNIALPTPVENNTQNLSNPEKCLSAYNAASPAYICQRYRDQYYFATLYDRGRRIPLYSAYKMDFKGEPESNVSNDNYEPQLVHPGLAKDQMKKIDCWREIQIYNSILTNDCKERVPQYQQKYKLNWSQAVEDDFVNYVRGQLNPAGHHRQNAFKATMTFTNVVPQNPKMNQVQWYKYEKKLKNVLSQGCSNMYVVTGVVPGKEWQNERVNVPSHYWNAFCCTDNNNKPIRSGGALCPNTVEGRVTEYDTDADLQNVLKNEMSFGNHFNIFNHCQISKGSGVYNHVYLFSLLCLPILFPLPCLCYCAKCKKKKCYCM